MKQAFFLIVLVVFLVGCVHEFHLEEEHVHDHHNHAVFSEQEFLVEMIPHHQEAIDTSRIIIMNSQNSVLVALAQEIIVEQEEEILYMQELLSAYEEERTATYSPMMGDLSVLSGSSLDIAYITGMIAHHQGALEMARSVLELRPSEEVSVLANNIIESQTTEILVLEQLLSEYE